MTDKGFNLFHQCLHMCSQEEECICSSWEDSKMYTPGSIASSQRMLTEINKSGATAKIRIQDGKWYCQTFKALRIISSKIKISLLIQVDEILVACIFRYVFYFHMSLKYFSKSLCPRYTDQLFWKIKADEQWL